MPIFSSVRRTGKADSSTSRMISSFSEAGYSCGVLPIRRHAFFQQTIFEGQLSHDLLQRAGLASQVPDLVRGRGSGRIASQSLLPGLEKVFRPAVIEVLDDPLAAAELGDAVLAAQAFQYNADLVFRREVSPRRAIFFTTSVAGSFSGTDFCLIFAPWRATMSQKSSLPQPTRSVS